MSNKTHRIFFDLDFTLYDTVALMDDLRRNLERFGASRSAIDAGFDQLNESGYSLENHLTLLLCPERLIPERVLELQYHLSHGKKYLMPGVFDGLVGLADNCDIHLLTFGFPQYQRSKFAGLQEIAGIFRDSHFVWKDEKKGDVIRGFGSDVVTWFLDDSPAHLEDACQKAPWVKAVRMMWPEFKLKPDNRDHIHWDVVRSFDEFVALVKRGG
ncbi:MAG: hypothetical protein WC551_07150 [Patescibacteria group bacterium]